MHTHSTGKAMPAHGFRIIPSSIRLHRLADLKGLDTGRKSALTLPKRDVAAAPLPRDIGSRFGLRLRELRVAHNLTQVQMSARFGIDRSFISDVERGRKSISLTLLYVIAIGMNLSLTDLLDGL